MPNSFENPQYLIGTDALAAQLQSASSDLRIFDCTTYLDPGPDNTMIVRNGRPGWEEGHIPGAGYLDLQGELSDANSSLRFMLPSAEQFAEVMGKHGVGDAHQVVLYSAGHMMWATRVWWMFRAFGFDRVSVLDGGLKQWKVEGRDISTAPASYPPATLNTSLRPGYFVGKASVLDAINGQQCAVVNALGHDQHIGVGRHYGRPGRIENTVNVQAADLVDESGLLRSPEALNEKFAQAGIERGRPVITYCGGGIAATADIFALCLLGYDQLSVYDASLSEWANDPSLPMAVGDGG